MYTIPIQVSPTQYDLWILMEEENIARIKRFDPVEVAMDQMPAPVQARRPRAILVVYVSAGDVNTIFNLL